MKIKKLDKTKIISKLSGNTISDIYDGFFYDYEGYLKVVLKKDKKTILYNFVNESGEEISKIWFKKYGKFKEGMVPVTLLDGTNNILTSDGQLILRKNNDFVSIEHFCNGFFIAKGKDGKYRLISRTGKQIKQYFDSIVPLDSENKDKAKFILVKRGPKCNIIGSDEEYLLDKFFINGYKLGNIFDVQYITKNPKISYHKFIDLRTGKVILEGEFSNVYHCHTNKYFWLKNKKNKCNVLNIEGKLLFQEWYDKILIQSWDFCDFTCFFVYKKAFNKLHEVFTVFDMKGNNIVNSIWFDSFEARYSEETVKLELTKNKYTYIYLSKENKLILI